MKNIVVWRLRKYSIVFVFILTMLFVEFFTNNICVFATIDPNGYYVNLQMQDQINIDIIPPTMSEQYVGATQSITLNTNAPSGYRLYMHTPNDGVSNGNLVPVGSSGAISHSISSVGFRMESAGALETNTWGFGIPNTTSGLPANNFSSSYSAESPSPESSYAGVEIDPTYTLLRNFSGSVPTDDSFDVYYGVRIDDDILGNAGTYQTNMHFYAFIEATDVVGGEAVIVPTSGPRTGNESVTITTSLKTDFVPPGVSVTIGGQDCLQPRGNVSTGVLRITCTTQSHLPEATDVLINIASLGISYTITGGYTYLETGEVKITNVSYVSGTNVNGTPQPSVGENNNVDFDLTFKSGIDDDQSFTATYRFTISNTTSSDYIFTAPSSNLTLRLSATNTSDVYYELDGITVGDTISAGSTVSFNVILTADYASGTHGVEGGMDVEPVEDRSGSLTGSILGTNTGDLSGDNELAEFQVSVHNTFKSDKVFTIDTLGTDFVVTNSAGGFLEAQNITAESTQTYTFYLKKSNGAVFGSDFVNATIVLSYDGMDTTSGQVRIAVDKDASYVDNQAPIISDVVVTKGSTVGTATVTWNGTDNVGVASYGIYPCVKDGDSYDCGEEISGIDGDINSYTLTGLADGVYGIVVVGYDDEGNTATQEEITDATINAGPASRSSDTELRYNFNVSGQITNGSLNNSGTTVAMGGTYSGNITANSNYSVPSSITVTMGDRTLSTSEYTYRNGSITINSVDGDIIITARCSYSWCLIEGTLIALADGSTKKIEDITYDDILKVWNYSTGSIGAERPAWIEKEAVTARYRLTKFSDGSELKTTGWHGVFDVDKNEFVDVENPEFGPGTRVYKVENDQLMPVTVVSTEIIEEEAYHYHVVSSQYYNIIANSILTTDGSVHLSNLYGFDENLKWPEIRNEIISDPNNLYTYDDFKDIGMPVRMFEELRVAEAKYLETKYGITLEVFKEYLKSNQLNPDLWLAY